MSHLNRRTVVAGASASAALALAGCVNTSPNPFVQAGIPPAPPPADLAQPGFAPTPVESTPLPPPDQTAKVDAPADLGADPNYNEIYGAGTNEPFPVPAIKLSQINKAYLRRNVAYVTNEPPGTIVVDPAHHYLYHVEEGGRATRYGVGVGKEGFQWAGEATIKSKQEWPDWYPPKEMIERKPELKKMMSQLQSGEGMHGGPKNPLGARAMYLWQGNQDTLFRIHGTVEPWSIGQSVSSGCIRMINQDAIDLYARTPVGTRVVVLGSGGGAPVKPPKVARS